MKNFQSHIAVIEKDNPHYNPWIIRKLKKPAIIYADKDDNILFVSTYGCARARTANPNYKDGWWKEYDVTPIECRQSGDDVLYVLYNADGTPKETDGNFSVPEVKFELSYTDEWENEYLSERLDENELYDKVLDYVAEEAEKERPYRYANRSIEPLLNKPNKISVRNVENNRAYDITYRFIDKISSDIADKNDGFCSVCEVAEKIWEVVIKELENN